MENERKTFVVRSKRITKELVNGKYFDRFIKKMQDKYSDSEGRYVYLFEYNEEVYAEFVRLRDKIKAERANRVNDRNV